MRHVGVSCDATGQDPILGPRFHKRGENYDLCEAAFAQLSAEEKAKYDRFDQPRHVMDWANHCRRGWRQRCQEEQQHGGAAVHRGITCDASGMSPIVGTRYWKLGENYDLCAAEFAKLNASEQTKYLAIEHPFSDEARRAWTWVHQARRHGHHGHHHHGHGRGGRNGHHFFHVRRHGPAADVPVVSFVRDVTIPDGSFVQPNTRFVKTWELRVEGVGASSAAALPAGTALVHVGGDALAGVAVPATTENPEDPSAFHVSISCVAPASTKLARSVWRLQEPGGRRFGPRVFVEVTTVDPVAAAAAAATARHEGITCDASGQCPILGTRYWKVGEDYDLCAAEFAKLGAAEQAKFRAIADPRGPEAAEARRALWRQRLHTGAEEALRGLLGAFSISSPAAAAAAAAAAAPAAPAPAAAAPVEDADARRELALKFLADITIPDGTRVQAGDALRKTWRVATADGWGTGMELRCLDADGKTPFAGLRQAVPAVPAGSQLDLSVTLSLPRDYARAGKLRSEFALHNSATGARFGDLLWVEVDVQAPEPEPQPAAVSVAAVTTTATGGGGGGAKEDDISAAAAQAEADAQAEAESAAGAFPGQADLLTQLLAGINVAPKAIQPVLSGLLYEALGNGSFKAILEALAKANIHLSQ